MKKKSMSAFLARVSIPLCLLVLGSVPRHCFATGVTFITHGLDGNVDGWIAGMANQLPQYSRFPGTNFTCYKARFSYSNGHYYLTASRVAGTQPLASDSGEIIVTFDWSQLADGNSYNTYQIAAAAVPALLNTNFIPELGGHALAEFPLHLVGHSRGGSLVCEISRQLGTNGVWVDHLTTLDPHPLNNDGFADIIYSAVDAPARTYANVLFHDNYWQDLNFFVYGEPVPGAYVRQLQHLDGGYSGFTASHSDVHLWYHGTVDRRIPASDTEASITRSERSSWWAAYESQGAVAGFCYSLIGGRDRLSTAQPAGPGFPAIRDGFNQAWDFGAGTSANRRALPPNNGNWPTLIKLNRTETNQVVQGQATPVKFFYQWAQPSTSTATVSFFLDNDLNPLNSNQPLLKEMTVPGNGAASVSYAAVSLAIDAADAAPGLYALYAKIADGARTRYLYAPEWVEVVTPLGRAISLSGDLAFGIVQTETTAQRTLTIANNGETAFTVTNILYPSGFTGDWAGSIPPHSAQPVIVTFSPTSTIAYTGTLQVFSDAASGNALLAVSGLGTSVPQAFSISVSASPAFGGTVTGGGTFSVNNLQTVTANPSSGYAFANWTESGAVVSRSASYSFRLSSARNLVANFVPPWFVLRKATFNGLFHETAQVSQNSSGSFVLTTTAMGKFSAKLQLGTARYSIRGRLDAGGRATATIPRRNMLPLSIVLQADFAPGSDRITGTVTDGTWTADLIGDRAVFDGKTSLAPQAGQYTMLLPGNSGSTAEPGGDSHGTVTVDKAGRIRLTGSLADATKITRAATLSKNGQWPLYVPLYRGQGSILSWITFTNSPTEDLTGRLVWIKSNLPSAKYYPAEFVCEVDAWGTRYLRPAPGENVLGMTNAYVTLTGPEFEQSLTNLININLNSRVTNLSSNKLSLTFNPRSGLFKGSVAVPGTLKPVPFTGVVLQKRNTACGFFLGATRSGSVLLEEAVP